MTKDEIRIWFSRIEKCEELQGKRNPERTEILKLYQGTFFGKPTDNTGEVTEVNFLYEYVDLSLASIYAKDPHIFVRAKSSKRYRFAETMETVINHYWAQLKLKKKIKQSILEAILIPPGFIELGYLFIKEIKESDKQLQKEIETEFPELKQPKKPLEEIGIFDDTIKEDDVFANSLSTFDVLWPDGYHDIRECPYLIKVSKIPLIDLKANKMFKDSRLKVNGFNSSTSSNKPGSFRLKDNVQPLNMNIEKFVDEENIEITLYHVLDKRSQTRFVLAKNFDEDTLFEKDWKYLPDGFPVFPLMFNEIPKTKDNAHSYPMSDAIPMLPQLKELSKISSAMMRHRKRAGTLILTRQDALSPSDITKITEASDVDVVPLENIDENSVKGFTPPALPPDFYNLRRIILEDLMRISGYQQLLVSTTSVETAEESRNIAQGTQIRQSARTDVIEDFTVDIASYLAGLIWQFKQDKNEISEIIGEDVSEDMWPSLPVNPEGEIDIDEARRIIQKELFFEIEAGATRPPKDEAVERKQWMDVVSMVEATFPGSLKKDVILPQMLKKFDFKDIDAAVIGFDEEEKQVSMEEIKLLLQDIPVPVSPNNNHKVHMEVMAQVFQQLGGKVTQSFEEHLVAHANYEERLSPSAKPQRGDTSASPRSKTPELSRRGVPEASDFVGAIKNLGQNSGPGQ